MFGTITPPVRRAGKEGKSSSSNNPMDMEAIRARRARLENIISMMRLPPLTRSSSMTNASLTKLPTTPAPNSITAAWLRRRRSLDAPSRAPITPTPTRVSPDGYIPLTPMTCRPFIQPLPDIGKMRLSDSLHPSPSVSRQASGKRNLASSPSPPARDNDSERLLAPSPSLDKRPATSKSRLSLGDVLTEEDEDDSEIPCSDDAIADLVKGMGSNSRERRLDCTVKSRKLLSREDNPPIREFLKAGVMTPLIPLLQSSNDSTLQFEATWTLTNLASGTSEQTATVVDAGAIPILVNLLKSNSDNVQEQSAWALGNITGDGAYYRNLVVQASGVTPLIDTLRITSSGITAKTSLVRVVAWVIANLFRHKGITIPPLERKNCLSALKMLINYDDKEVNIDALWAIGYVADMDEESLDDVVAAGLVPPLVTHMKSDSRGMIIPALRAIGNIAAGDDVQTDTVLDNQALPILKELMAETRTSIRKDAIWTISNIMAGNRSQIQRLIDGGLLPGIIEAIGCGLLYVQKEATWAANNLTAGGSHAQMASLIDAKAIPALVDVLSIGETDIISVALRALQNLLKIPGKEEEVKDIIAGEGGIRKLEVLEEYIDPSISEKATTILKSLRNEGGDSDDDSDASE